MGYIREKFVSADRKIIVVKKYQPLFLMTAKEKNKQRRMAKQGETSDKQKKINERLAQEKYMRLLADNFKPGDFYITLTTAEKMDADEFKAEMKNFMKRLRRAYKKATGESLKYFRVMENLAGGGRTHAHILIPKFCPAENIRSAMASLWTAGRSKVELYGGKAQDAYNISSYFTKDKAADHGAKIDTSRGNLIRRQPKKKIIHANYFRDEIKAPRGYQVVKPLSYNTWTDAGHYQIAVFEKIERGQNQWQI